MQRFMLWLVLTLLSVSASAQAYGSWIVGVDDQDLPYMLTVDESGNAFGKWCDEDSASCFWVFASSKVKCIQGSSSSILINTGTSAVNTTMTCGTPFKFESTKLWRSVLSNPDVLDQIAAKSDRLGIAVATEDGLFRVMQFSMTGSGQAFERWQSLVKPAAERLARKPRDTTMRL